MGKATLCIPTTEISSELLDTVNNFYLGSHAELEVVIVVDNGEVSTLAEAFSFLGRNFKLIRLEKRLGPAHARNLAAETATGEVLIFVDSDVVVPPPVFNILTQVKDQEILVPAALPLGITTKASAFFSDFALAPKVMDGMLLPVSACFSIRKNLFASVNGFDENFKYPAGEDWDFFKRVQISGAVIKFDMACRVFHRNPRTILGVAKRSYRYARHGAAQNEHGIETESFTAASLPSSKKALIYFPLVLAIGVLKIFASTLSVGNDWYSRLVAKLQTKQDTLLETMAKFRARSSLQASWLRRFSTRVLNLGETLQAFPTSNPWEPVVPVRPDLEDKDRKRYRTLVAVWRFTYMFGYILRVRSTSKK